MATRPDRSDSHLSAEEEARVVEETQAYFEGVAPKRHTKPQRSEFSAQYADALESSEGGHAPEIDRLHDLEADPELICGGTEPGEEFSETEYYKDLNGVGKQHHTTGAGFIRIEEPRVSPLKLGAEDGDHHESCRSNPATNDWIPSAELVVPTSNKPGRSDL
ncbi:maternal effect embryo arrest 59 isoform X2 [Wolffia australiana]